MSKFVFEQSTLLKCKFRKRRKKMHHVIWAVGFCSEKVFKKDVFCRLLLEKIDCYRKNSVSWEKCYVVKKVKIAK